MSLLKKIFKIKNKKYIDPYKDCVFIEEIVPLFSDNAGTTNKRIYKIKNTIEPNNFIIGDINKDISYDKNKMINTKRLLSQDNILIKVYDNEFLKGNFNKEFVKNNYAKNDVYEFKELGYLGNISSVEKVRLVTDQYVIFDTGNSISIRSFDELNKLIKEKV